jgi:hypothetical protein
MSVIDDLTAAVEAYPRSNVQILIEDPEFPGDVLNVEEEGSFKGATPPGCARSGPLPRRLPCIAARVARCRVGGGALQVGWSCFAARVQLCRVSDRIVTQFGAYGGTPGGKAPPTRQRTSTGAAKCHPRGKPPQPARQRVAVAGISGQCGMIDGFGTIGANLSSRYLAVPVPLPD